MSLTTIERIIQTNNNQSRQEVITHIKKNIHCHLLVSTVHGWSTNVMSVSFEGANI